MTAATTTAKVVYSPAPSSPYARVAHQLVRNGWSPIPLPMHTKMPPPTGRTGRSALAVTPDDVNDWINRGMYRKPSVGSTVYYQPVGNVALALPDGVVGIDVDTYDGKQGAETMKALTKLLGKLPRTVVSSRRFDTHPQSGIRFFRVPPGTELVGNLADRDANTADVEVIQKHHRYAVTAPSEVGGEVYRIKDQRLADTPEIVPVWRDVMPPVDTLPMLPGAWIDHLRVQAPRAATAPGADPVDLGAGGHPSHLVQQRLAELLQEIVTGSRHDAVTRGVMGLVRLAERGETGVAAALEQAREAFVQAVTRDGSRTPAAAAGEWERMVPGAQQKVAETPTPKVGWEPEGGTAWEPTDTTAPITTTARPATSPLTTPTAVTSAGPAMGAVASSDLPTSGSSGASSSPSDIPELAALDSWLDDLQAGPSPDDLPAVASPGSGSDTPASSEAVNLTVAAEDVRAAPDATPGSLVGSQEEAATPGTPPVAIPSGTPGAAVSTPPFDSLNPVDLTDPQDTTTTEEAPPWARPQEATSSSPTSSPSEEATSASSTTPTTASSATPSSTSSTPAPTETPQPEYVPSWQPVDTGLLLDDDYEGPKATLWPISGGHHLLYPGAVHQLFGQPETWKSWLSLCAIKATLETGGRALLIDAEDRAIAAIGRLRQLGVSREQIVAQLDVVEPSANPHTPAEYDAFQHLVALEHDVVVIDSVTRTGALSGIKSNDQDSMTHWFGSVPAPFARRGAAVIVVDHVPKPSKDAADGAERYAGGSNAKLGIVQVSLRVSRTDRPEPRKGAVGYGQISVTKDRHGDIKEHASLFDFTVDSTGDIIDVDIRAVATPESATPDELQANARASIIRALQFHGGGLGVVELRKEARTYTRGAPLGKNVVIDDAAVALAREGVITRTVSGKSTISKLTEEWKAKCRTAGIPIPDSEPAEVGFEPDVDLTPAPLTKE